MYTHIVECNHITLLHLYSNYIINVVGNNVSILLCRIVYLEAQFLLGVATARTGASQLVKSELLHIK